MAEAYKPDHAQAKKIISAAAGMDAIHKQIVDSQAAVLANAQKAAQAVYDLRVRQTLEQMDIEQLNKGKQGLRIPVLREAGLENVWQVSRLNYQQLCDIHGLGEQSAEKIQETVKQILEQTKSSVRVRLDADHIQDEDTALVCQLYIMVTCKPLWERSRRIYTQHHGAVQQEIKTAKRLKNGISWFFTGSSRKELAQQALESLQYRLQGEFGDTAAVQAWQSALEVQGPLAWADFQQKSAQYYAALESVGKSWAKYDVEQNGLPSQLARQIELQELDLRHLKATLRSYQTFGTKYILHQKRSLLGDEMGLGKTVQAIAAMAALKAAGETHFMVVCPASVLINWCREIVQHSTLSVTKIHGGDEEALLHWRENGDVAVTTYESISRFELPEQFKFAMLVSDEAHYVKNPEALRTRSMAKLLKKTERVLFMSGTPLENNVDEMCFLVKSLKPEVAAELERVKYITTAKQFREKLAPVYLRRTREDVLQELPELTEKAQWCEMSKKEAAAYKESVRSGNFMAMRQVSWQMPDLQESSKARRLVELCDQAREEGRKIIVFTFFRDTISKVCGLLGDRCLEPVTGSVTPQRRQEIVDAFKTAENGTVLVSQVQAGGTGLNIQCASVVIFCEPQIKPSIENQAISRAYRMGQVRDVLVFRLLCEDSVDEKILEILKEKQTQFDSFADESVVGTEALKEQQAQEKESAWIARMVQEEQKRLAVDTPPAEPEQPAESQG